MWSTGNEDIPTTQNRNVYERPMFSDHHCNFSSYGNFEPSGGFPVNPLWDDHYTDSGFSSGLHSQSEHVFSPMFLDHDLQNHQSQDAHNIAGDPVDESELFLQKFITQLQISEGLITSKHDLSHQSVMGSTEQSTPASSSHHSQYQVS